MKIALRFARRVVFQSAPRRRERGINILLLTVLGIIATLVFLGVGIAPMLGTVDSTKIAKAKEMMATDIATQVHNYYMNTNQFPGTTTAADVVTALGSSYFPATPCDPSDSSCTPTSSTSDFTIASGLDASNRSDYDIFDTVAHPGASLNGMNKWTANFTAPATTCSAGGCTKLVYDGLYGIMAK